MFLSLFPSPLIFPGMILINENGVFPLQYLFYEGRPQAKRISMKRLTILFSFLFLASCSGVSLKYKPVSIKELVPVGSTARLTEAIEVPADRAYVYIANGKVMPFKNYNTVDVRKPYCRFGFAKPDARARQIQPDFFRITKIVEWEDYHGKIGNPQWARLDQADVHIHGGFQFGVLDFNDGGPSIIMYATIMTLHSDRQPQVKELVCGHWDEQGIVEPLTLTEMKTALGNLIVVNVVGSDKT